MESDTELSSGVSHGEFKQYRCKNGMWDIATPIIVGGQHVGNAFLGQFFFDDESLDYELFRAQAKKYGFNEEEYIIALEKVPRLNREVVELGMTFIMNLANLLSQLSYNNNRLAQSLSERDALVDALRESEKRERARSEELVVVLDAVPAAVMIAHDPQALEMTGNRLSYEWIRLPEGTNISKALPERKRAETHKLFKDGVEIPLADMPLRMSASGKEVHDYEFDVVYPDGKIRHVLGNARPLLDEQGNSRGAVAALMDITERKQTEEALNKAYEQLQIQSEELQASNEELLAQSEELLAQTEKIQDAYHALSKSEERYRMLFTNMTEAFFLAEIIYNEEGQPFDLRYLEINPAFELHTGIHVPERAHRRRTACRNEVWVEALGLFIVMGEVRNRFVVGFVPFPVDHFRAGCGIHEQVLANRLRRHVDEIGAIVIRFDLDARQQLPWVFIQFLDLALDVAQSGQRVLVLPQQHDALHLVVLVVADIRAPQLFALEVERQHAVVGSEVDPVRAVALAGEIDDAIAIEVGGYESARVRLDRDRQRRQ